MKNNYLKTLLAAVLAVFGGGAVFADEGTATVKMTYVDGGNADASYGEVTTVAIGYLKISNTSLALGNSGWGANNVAYLQVDASAIDGTITNATLSATLKNTTGKRNADYHVGYNSSDWSSTLTWNIADKSVTTIGDAVSVAKAQSTTGTFDITDAFKNDDDKIVTLLVYCTNAGGSDFSDPTVTITYAAAGAKTYNYTISAVAGETTLKELATGTDVEGATYSQTGIPEVIEKDGAYYRLSDANVTDRQESFTIGTSDLNGIINYTKDDDIAFFKEIEDCGYTGTNYPETKANYLSNGSAIAAMGTGKTIDIPFTISSDGTYKLTMPCVNINNRARQYTINLISGEETLYTSETATVAINGSGTFEYTTALAAGDYTLRVNIVYSLTPAFDYLLIEKAASPTVTVSTTSNLCSYSNANAVTVPDDVTIYIATKADATDGVTLTAVETKVIPANTGVILYSNGGGEKALTYGGTADATLYADNLLKATGSSTYTATGTEYALVKDAQEVANITADVVIPANKAYLTIEANAAKLAVNFGGSVSTGINAVGAASFNVNGATYNIAGQRVGASYKGLVVKNGKKYLRK